MLYLDIIDKINDYLTVKDFFSFSRTCKQTTRSRRWKELKQFKNFDQFAREGLPEMVFWWFNHSSNFASYLELDKDRKKSNPLLWSAIKLKHSTVVQWVLTSSKIEFHDKQYIYLSAIKNNWVSIAEHLYQQGCTRSDGDWIIMVAIRHGNLGIVQWIWSKNKKLVKKIGIQLAHKYRQQHIVDWLIKN